MKDVLLVVAHAAFRESMALLLEWQAGCGSVQIRTLAEARQVLDDGRHANIGLAVVDLDFPSGDADALIEELRSAETPVLAFTARRNLMTRARAFQAGADEVLSLRVPGERLVGAALRLGTSGGPDHPRRATRTARDLHGPSRVRRVCR